MASEIKVDTISEKTSANGVTIDNLTIKDGGIVGDVTFADGAYDFDIASHDTSNGLKLGGTLVTSTATELNKLDGVGTLKEVGKETIWVPANAMTPTNSNGCSDLTKVETTSGRPDLNVLDFDDGSDEHAQFAIAFPKSWNLGTITFQVFWTSTATDTDGVSWGLQGVAMNDNETQDVAYGTAIVVDDACQSAAEELYVTAESGAVTIAGTPADNDLTYFRIFRDVSDANDTAAEDARLLGCKIFFTTDAANDAQEKLIMSFGYQVLGFGSGVAAAPYDAEYLVVAGGGGGGYRGEPTGGGGAGGYRTNYGGTAISLTPGTEYTITVGAGGAGSTSTDTDGAASGANSSLAGADITNITSTGGGGGAGGTLDSGGKDGGSGGGGYYGGSSPENQGGDGNAGGYSPVEGYDGGNGTDGGPPSFGGGGGGGSAGAGANGTGSSGGAGGIGTSNAITGSGLFYAAGGGGGASGGGAVAASASGIGGVGAEGNTSAATAGAANTGSGGGSGDSRGTYAGKDGADGVVILRVLTADYSGTTSGSPTVTTTGSDTVIKFTGNGTYTA